MGATIVLTLLLVAVLAGATWTRDLDVSPGLAWGLRLGLGVFVLGALEGVAMVAVGASAVGPGPALPGVGWNVGGDLRIAHFVGLHALQLLPLVGFVAERRRGGLLRPTWIVAVVAVVQTAVLLGTVAHALCAPGG